MTTVVRVQVPDLNLNDDTLDDRLAEFDNATFSEVDGLAFITVYVDDGQSVVDTVLEATRTLAAKIPGTIAKRVHPDLVTTSDIAHRVGVSREAVRKWVKDTRKPFPTQFDNITAGHQRVWRWAEVVEWLLKAKAIDMDEDLPSLADIAHIDAWLNKVPDMSSHAWAMTQTDEIAFSFTATGRRTSVAPVIEMEPYRKHRVSRGEEVSSAV
jgi:predicted DNA-binding transcriptional regulator AlpA